MCKLRARVFPGTQNAPLRHSPFAWPTARRFILLIFVLLLAVEIEVDRESGSIRPLRVVAAIDSGEAVNPDGIRNQTEGGVLQSMSWTLYESVSFDRTRVTSKDWSTYPILRFSNVPEKLDVHLITRPGMPFLGTGEAAQGPTGAAIANALADAIGARVRELPLTRAPKGGARPALAAPLLQRGPRGFVAFAERRVAPRSTRPTSRLVRRL